MPKMDKKKASQKTVKKTFIPPCAKKQASLDFVTINPMSKVYIFEVAPMPKPRMTQRDKWAHRPVVEKYFAYRDELRLISNQLKFKMPGGFWHLVFHIPMPKSWSKKKQESLNKQPHQNKPDLDNLIKGFFDAVCVEDAFIWDGRTTKLWSTEGRIEFFV